VHTSRAIKRPIPTLGRARIWGVRLRPSCSDVGKSQAGTVDDAVTNPQPPVLLSSSQGHYYVCIDVMLTRVVIFPVLLLTGLCVLRDAPAKARVALCLRLVAHAVGHIGRRLALVCHAQGIEVRAFLARMCLFLQEKQDGD
jgi:hypothetical protein